MEDFCNYQEVYSPEQTKLISEEFSRLKGQYYLEHAGTTLYSEKQLQDIFGQLSENLYANPHARNLSSKLTEDAIDVIRYQILTHFKTNPEEYSVIFTSGATASLKLIAESFNYGDEGYFIYLQDNHTSVLGMRSYAPNRKCLKVAESYEVLAVNTNCEKFQEIDSSLFVYPAQSNFSGVKYPLEWIKNARNGNLNQFAGINCKNWFVALDAASYASTNELDLALYKPDFVVISFYKIFGYPTGLGALLVRNCSAGILKRTYFGGGTVFMTQALNSTVILRDVLHERFEDGSPSFLSILSLREGFNTLKRLQLNFEIISKHTFSLAKYIYRSLACLRHSNGRPAVILYHPSSFENSKIQGSIVNFNLVRNNGEYIGYSEILHFANLYDIHLRTGCFCNPGACQHFLNLSSDDIQRHFEAGHVCGDQHDLVNGYPTGSIRISFGYMSKKIDADRLLEMIENCFIIKPILKELPDKNDSNCETYYHINSFPSSNDFNFEEGTLEGITIYPVKSCAGFSPLTKWPITAAGLKFDRQWMVINSAGVCFTQKNNKFMCLIRPKICLEENLLELTYPNYSPIQISLDINSRSTDTNVNFCQSKVCGDQIKGWDCGDEVSNWLSKVLDAPGLRLLQASFSKSNRKSKQNEQLNLSLANKAQYLIINKSSVEWLRKQITDQDFTEPLQTTVQRFRPNFLVKFHNPFAENDYKEFIINGLKFQNAGRCTRCQMICIDQNTGITSKEPLQSISRVFKGKISFGVYLKRFECDMGDFVYVGSSVHGIRGNENKTE